MPVTDELGIPYWLADETPTPPWDFQGYNNFDNVIAKPSTKDVGGGSDVALVLSDCEGPVVILTGTLTANIDVSFPRRGRWIVKNMTNGPFTLRLKGSPTGKGMLIGQGTVRTIWNDGTSVMPAWTNRQSRNFVLNGSFEIAQSGPIADSTTTPNNNNQTYGVGDVWMLLSDGDNIVKTERELSIVPPGAAACLKMEVVNPNKKWGYVQFLESIDSAQLKNQRVSLSFKARTANLGQVNNVRAALLSWTSTMDAPSYGVISSWNAQGIDPTFGANYTRENNPDGTVWNTSYGVTIDGWSTIKVEGLLVDTSGMVNVALVVWVDDTDANIGDTLYLGDVQLELGEFANEYQRKSWRDEFDLVARYYEKLEFDQVGAELVGSGFARGSQRAWCFVEWRRKRAAPAASMADSSKFQVYYRDFTINGQGGTGQIDQAGKYGARLRIDVAGTPFTPGEGIFLARNSLEEAFVIADSRL